MDTPYFKLIMHRTLNQRYQSFLASLSPKLKKRLSVLHKINDDRGKDWILDQFLTHPHKRYFEWDNIVNRKTFRAYEHRYAHKPAKPIPYWHFTVIKGKPSPSGLIVNVMYFRTKKVMPKPRKKVITYKRKPVLRSFRYVWQFVYSGVAGDAKNAGVPYGVYCTRKPKKAAISMPGTIKDLTWQLISMDHNLIKTKGEKDEKEKNERTLENLLGELGLTF